MPSQDFSVVFDVLFRRQEKKVAGATIEMMEKILRNAGLDEGEWVLRDSHRIKKKGRERFHAIRAESRSGAKSVRVWCKPKGNDTCFEYSLVPPPEFDAGKVLVILKRTNPVTLEVAESPGLALAFLNRAIDGPPLPVPAPWQPKIVEVPDLPATPEETVVGDKEVKPLEGHAVSEVSLAFEKTPAEVRWTSLKINEACLLSDQEAMDFALMAMSFVMHDKYAKKSEASNSIIENLGLIDFVNRISGGTYTSKEGAMRSLTMALRNKGNYIERVYYSSGSGRSSDAVKGYKLTPKGEKRITLLMERCSESIRAKMSPDWNTRMQESVQKQMPEECDQEEDHGSCVAADEDGHESQDLEGLGSDALVRLEELISGCRAAEAHIREIDGLIANLDSELADLQIDADGLSLAEEEKIKQMEELNTSLEKIRAKRNSVDHKIEQKKMDKEAWEKEKAPIASEKTQIEKEIFEFTGRRRAR